MSEAAAHRTVIRMMFGDAAGRQGGGSAMRLAVADR